MVRQMTLGHVGFPTFKLPFRNESSLLLLLLVLLLLWLLLLLLLLLLLSVECSKVFSEPHSDAGDDCTTAYTCLPLCAHCPTVPNMVLGCKPHARPWRRAVAGQESPGQACGCTSSVNCTCGPMDVVGIFNVEFPPVLS